MKKKKYILFHHSFDKAAGTERVLFNIMEFLFEQGDGDIVLVLASDNNTLAFDISKFNVDVVNLGMDLNVKGGPLSLITFHVSLQKRMSAFTKGLGGQFDYICFATNPFLSAIAYRSFKRSGLFMEVIACEHFALSVSGRQSQIVRKYFYPKMSVVALTEKDRDELSLRFKPKRCICIPNASPFSIQAYAGHKRENVILAIGRLGRQKGFDMLLEAFASIQDKIPEWRLLIVGDDYGEKASLELIIKQLSIKNAILEPATSDIARYYQSAAFFVLSSRFEGLPMVLIESMSFGLPIVSFDCPTGPSLLVSEQNGILVEDGRIDLLAEAMLELANNHKLRLEKALGSQKRAENYTKEKINELWQSLLQSL